MTTISLDFRQVVIFARDHPEARWLAARLAERGQLSMLFLERRPFGKTMKLWWRRARRNGIVETGSSGMALLADRLLTWRVVEAPMTRTEVVHPTRVQAIDSVNDDAVRRMVAETTSTVGLVLGTTILGADLINSFGDVPLLNLHSGHTPRYRGTHGGAWALLDGHPELVASTWHLIDVGIDTGRPVVHVPVTVRPTLSLMAREHRRAGVHFLDGLAQRHIAVIDIPEAAEPGRLKYPPGFGDWRRFRRIVRTLAKGNCIRDVGSSPNAT